MNRRFNFNLLYMLNSTLFSIIFWLFFETWKTPKFCAKVALISKVPWLIKLNKWCALKLTWKLCLGNPWKYVVRTCSNDKMGCSGDIINNNGNKMKSHSNSSVYCSRKSMWWINERHEQQLCMIFEIQFEPIWMVASDKTSSLRWDIP